MVFFFRCCSCLLGQVQREVLGEERAYLPSGTDAQPSDTNQDRVSGCAEQPLLPTFSQVQRALEHVQCALVWWTKQSSLLTTAEEGFGSPL